MSFSGSMFVSLCRFILSLLRIT